MSSGLRWRYELGEDELGGKKGLWRGRSALMLLLSVVLSAAVHFMRRFHDLRFAREQGGYDLIADGSIQSDCTAGVACEAGALGNCGALAREA